MAGTEGNDLRELKELVEFLKANGIAEFEMERPDLKVVVSSATLETSRFAEFFGGQCRGFVVGLGRLSDGR